MFLATVATEFILSEAFDGSIIAMIAFVPGIVFMLSLFIIMEGFLSKERSTVLGGSIIALIFGGMVVALLISGSSGGDYLADAKKTVQEIEDEYGIEFKTKDFANKVITLTGEKPTEDNTYTLENLIYSHDDSFYSTDLTIFYSIDDRDRSVIELYSTSDAENLTPFDPSNGEPASSTLTLTEKE